MLAFAAAVAMTGFCVHAQDGPATVDPHRNQVEDDYLNRQAEALLNVAGETLSRIPPQYPEPRERRLALLLMDGVLHDAYAAHRPPVQKFYNERMERALKDLEDTKVTKGARIWKLYNMAFVVRTATVTVAFDLVDGASAKSPSFTMPGAIMERFIAQCDALFISHRHNDHVKEQIAQAFLDQGKPVVAPPEVWECKAIHDQITHLNREAHTVQTLKIQNGQRELKVVIYPGHQGKNVENNVSLVISPEGISFCHCGDQINEEDFLDDYKWIDEVRDHQQVDIFMPNCWTNEIFRIVRGFNPRLVLPGHEVELGHSIDDRVPYWGDSEYLQLTYPELLKSQYPVIVMTWGESISYSKKN
jgi:L-ascorbate metabolism protein UlaG (beta-lactamase superfamily)